MPELKNYRLFISHSWTYKDAYDKLVYFFNQHPYFNWTNYSVPKNDPIHNAPNQTLLRAAIRRQIASTNCVIVLAGVYSSYSKWINIEIDIAKNDFQKPLIAVQPWGAEKTSTIVKQNADIIVNWNSKSIVDAIRQFSI